MLSKKEKEKKMRKKDEKKRKGKKMSEKKKKNGLEMRELREGQSVEKNKRRH